MPQNYFTNAKGKKWYFISILQASTPFVTRPLPQFLVTLRL